MNSVDPWLYVALAVTYLAVLALAVTVWLFPSLFAKVLRLGRRGHGFPLERSVWSFIDHPSYVWFARGVVSIMLVAMSVLMWRMLL
jgi:hypothetical protein